MNNLTPIFALLLSLTMANLSTHFAYGQSSDSPILFIYDASGSMWGKIGDETKKEAASTILIQTINKLGPDQKIGFMAYGHRSKGDCEDVELLVDLENSNKPKLISTIAQINPLGKTPLAYSAELAISKIKEANAKTTIILVTDGIESCNGDLCKVIKLARQAGVEFKLHIVGFGLKDGESEALKCAAKEGNGNYYDAEDASQLAEVLDDAINQKIDDPEPNHSFYSTKNGKPVDSWIKILDQKTGKETGVTRTYQDTVHINLPIGEYNVTVNPLEGTDIAKKTLKLVKAVDGPSHTNISFDGGSIKVFVSNNNEGWDAVIKVFDQQSQEVIATSRTYGKEQIIEVNTGTYVVDILALVIKGGSLRHKIENVVVEANKTNSVSHDYKTGTLSVGVNTQSGELVDATVNISDPVIKAFVTGSRTYTRASSNPKSIIITPGTYEIKITTLGVHKGTTKTEMITVQAGKESTKIFKIY